MYRVSLLFACRPGLPLVTLAERMPRETFEEKFEELYCPDNGCPGLPIRMMVGLLLLKRRQAIEPLICYIKHDGLPGRNYLKDTESDRMNARLSCAVHNMRIILKKTRIICANFLRRLFSCVGPKKTNVVPRLPVRHSTGLKTH